MEVSIGANYHGDYIFYRDSEVNQSIHASASL
jgi:hypothetical protein